MDSHIRKGNKAKKWLSLVDDLGHKLRINGKRHDSENTFVQDNYDLLQKEGILTALIPESLGGGGMPYETMCQILVRIAIYCPSTSLALSMHQHLVATTMWKYQNEGKGGELLREVVKNNEILVSTGAGDWLDSNGTMLKTDGGYLVSAKKRFASQSVVGSILVTSASYFCEKKGWQVLHFRLPMSSEGVYVLDDWDTLSMRGTGSQTVKLEKVFVPDKAIEMQRPQGEYPSFWNVVLTLALPLIMSPYLGIANRATEIVYEKVQSKEHQPPSLPFMLGEMYNKLTAAQVLYDDMIRLANNLDFKAEDRNAPAVLARKTLVANACKATVSKAMETIGGASIFRSSELERLFRDVQAASFHTLSEKHQLHFTGEFLLRNNN